MHKFKIVALVAASGLALAACGGVGSNSNPPAAGGGGESNATGGGSKTLSISGFGTPDEIATVRLDESKKKLGLTLKLNEGALDDQQFLTSVAAKNPTDIVAMGANKIASYAQSGALQPLDDCIAKNGIDTSQYREQALATVTYKDKIYGIPEFYNFPLLLVNNRVAKEAGIDPKSIDTGDWNNIIDAGKKMTKIEGGKLTRLGFDARIPDASSLWPVAVHGLPLMDDDGLTSHLDDPKVIDVYANIKKLVDAQGGWTRVKSFKDSWDFFGEKNPFATDQVGAMVIEQWYLNVLANTAPDKVDFTTLPIKDVNGQPTTLAGSNSWAIPNHSKNPDVACQFAREMTAVSSWEASAKARVEKRKAEGSTYTGTYTGNKLADEKIFGADGKGGIWQPAGGKYAMFDQGVQTALEVMALAKTDPTSPIGAQLQTAMTGALNRMLQGDEDPATALKRAQSEVSQAAASVK